MSTYFSEGTFHLSESELASIQDSINGLGYIDPRNGVGRLLNVSQSNGTELSERVQTLIDENKISGLEIQGQAQEGDSKRIENVMTYAFIHMLLEQNTNTGKIDSDAINEAYAAAVNITDAYCSREKFTAKDMSATGVKGFIVLGKREKVEFPDSK